MLDFLVHFLTLLNFTLHLISIRTSLLVSFTLLKGLKCVFAVILAVGSRWLSVFFLYKHLTFALTCVTTLFMLPKLLNGTKNVGVLVFAVKHCLSSSVFTSCYVKLVFPEIKHFVIGVERAYKNCFAHC